MAVIERSNGCIIHTSLGRHLLDVLLHAPFSTGDEYILAGDEVVVSKAGDETYGKDCIFSSLAQRPIPGLAFFAFSLINVRLRRSTPIKVEQIVRSEEEKAACKAKAQARKTKKKPDEKRKPGRPKGSQEQGQTAS